MSVYSQFEALYDRMTHRLGRQAPLLEAIRKKGLDFFIAQGFPTREQEDWKYTDLSFLAQKSWTFPIIKAVEHIKLDQHAMQDEIICQLVFVDGYFCWALSTLPESNSGIAITSVRESVQNLPEQMLPYLQSSISGHSAMIALNKAFAQDGFVLHVQEGCALSLPIHILYLSTSAPENTLMCASNFIFLEQNTSVHVFEEHRHLMDAQADSTACLLKNMHTQVYMNANAQLNYYKFQQEDKSVVHVSQMDVAQSQKSELTTYHISLGAALNRENIQVSLNQVGASCVLNGLYMLSDRQHTDYHTKVDHNCANTQSHECYKGVLKDHAKGVFNGKIVVKKDAQKIKSVQINRNLLLSKTAEMNAKPELEIYADDVQCSHGATVGQIEPEMLFYLRARGLSEQEATHVLTQAFYNEIFEKIPNASLANYMRHHVSI